MSEIAYTVGNPQGYDQELAEGPVEKAEGGVLFRHFADAKACLGKRGILPPAWFGGEVKPGAVYELEVEGTVLEASEPWPDAALRARRLVVSAQVRGRLDARGRRVA
jgi:hypothetical protein